MRKEKFNIGDIVKVTDTTFAYTSLDLFFDMHRLGNLKYQFKAQERKLPHKNAIYQVVAIGDHPKQVGYKVLVLHHPCTNSVYVIDHEGVELFAINLQDYEALTLSENEFEKVNRAQREEIMKLRKEFKDVTEKFNTLEAFYNELITADLLNDEQREAIQYYCDCHDCRLYWVADNGDDIELTFIFNKKGTKLVVSGQSLCATIMEELHDAMDDRLFHNEWDEAEAILKLYRKCGEWWQ